MLPPLTDDQRPLAVLLQPPQTAEKSPEIVLSDTATSTTERLKLCPTPYGEQLGGAHTLELSSTTAPLLGSPAMLRVSARDCSGPGGIACSNGLALTLRL